MMEIHIYELSTGEERFVDREDVGIPEVFDDISAIELSKDWNEATDAYYYYPVQVVN